MNYETKLDIINLVRGYIGCFLLTILMITGVIKS